MKKFFVVMLMLSAVLAFSSANAQFVGRTFGVRRLLIDAGDGVIGNNIYLIDRNGSIGLDATGLTTGGFPSSCAILDLSSTTKGFLPPRMNNLQELAICGGSPPLGLIVVNTDKRSLDFYNGSAYASPWMTKGNFLTDPTVDFIGTNELTDFVFRTNLIERMRILGGGNIAIGAPTANAHVQITETGAQDAMNITNSGSQRTLVLNSTSASAATVLNITRAGTGNGINLSSSGASTTNLFVLNGTADATVGNVAADNVWESRIIGDQLITGILKVGGSIWFDGNSATQKILSDAPFNIGTKNSNTLSLITNNISHISIDAAGNETFTGNSFGATFPAGFNFTGTGSSNGNFVASFTNTNNGNGVSIQVNAGTPDHTNHFMEFRNSGGTVVGSIQGQTIADLHATPQWIEALRTFDANITLASLNAAVTTAQTAVGVIELAIGVALAADVADPLCDVACPGSVAAGAAEVGLGAANTALNGAQTALNVAQALESNTEKTNYININEAQIGVAFNSGAGDYAEWLPKMDMSENFVSGNIIAVKGGVITKNTDGATQLMVVSRQPIVLGNTPIAGRESNYEKVAFMGQVPVLVMGKVNRGDYILPSGGSNGLGIAVSPEKMTASDYKKIVGVAWTPSTNDAVTEINVAVGINTLAAGNELERQAQEINSLKASINQTNTLLAKLVPGFKEALGTPIAENNSATNLKSSPDVAMKGNFSTQGTTPTMKIDDLSKTLGTPGTPKSTFYTREVVEKGIADARQKLTANGIDLSKNPFYLQYDSNAAFKEATISTMLNKLNAAMDRQQELKLAKKNGTTGN